METVLGTPPSEDNHDDIFFNDDKLQKLKKDFILLKKKIFCSQDLIQKYTSKVKENEKVKADLQLLVQEKRKNEEILQQKVVSLKSDNVRLKCENTQFRQTHKELVKKNKEFETQISSDKQYIQQLTCKFEDIEEKNSQAMMEIDIEKSGLQTKVKELEQELRKLRKKVEIPNNISAKNMRKRGRPCKLKKNIDLPSISDDFNEADFDDLQPLASLQESEKILDNCVENSNNAEINTDVVPMPKNLPEVIINKNNLPVVEINLPKKPITNDKYTTTDEFYHIQNNPYPLFCHKCQDLLDPQSAINTVINRMQITPLITDFPSSPVRIETDNEPKENNKNMSTTLENIEEKLVRMEKRMKKIKKNNNNQNTASQCNHPHSNNCCQGKSLDNSVSLMNMITTFCSNMIKIDNDKKKNKVQKSKPYKRKVFRKNTKDGIRWRKNTTNCNNDWCVESDELDDTDNTTDNSEISNVPVIAQIIKSSDNRQSVDDNSVRLNLENNSDKECSADEQIVRQCSDADNVNLHTEEIVNKNHLITEDIEKSPSENEHVLSLQKDIVKQNSIGVGVIRSDGTINDNESISASESLEANNLIDTNTKVYSSVHDENERLHAGRFSQNDDSISENAKANQEKCLDRSQLLNEHITTDDTFADEDDLYSEEYLDNFDSINQDAEPCENIINNNENQDEAENNLTMSDGKARLLLKENFNKNTLTSENFSQNQTTVIDNRNLSLDVYSRKSFHGSNCQLEQSEIVMDNQNSTESVNNNICRERDLKNKENQCVRNKTIDDNFTALSTSAASSLELENLQKSSNKLISSTAELNVIQKRKKCEDNYNFVTKKTPTLMMKLRKLKTQISPSSKLVNKHLNNTVSNSDVEDTTVKKRRIAHIPKTIFNESNDESNLNVSNEVSKLEKNPPVKKRRVTTRSMIKSYSPIEENEKNQIKECFINMNSTADNLTGTLKESENISILFRALNASSKAKITTNNESQGINNSIVHINQQDECNVENSDKQHISKQTELPQVQKIHNKILPNIINVHQYNDDKNDNEEHNKTKVGSTSNSFEESPASPEDNSCTAVSMVQPKEIPVTLMIPFIYEPLKLSESLASPTHSGTSASSSQNEPLNSQPISNAPELCSEVDEDCVKTLRSRKVSISPAKNCPTALQTDSVASTTSTEVENYGKQIQLLLDNHIMTAKKIKPDRKISRFQIEAAIKLAKGAEEFIKMELSNLVDTETWSNLNNEQTATNLKSINRRSIAKVVVEFIIKLSELKEPLDSTFTPPAPMMTKSQQRIVALLHRLDVNDKLIIYNVLDNIEYHLFRINSEISYEAVEELARIYAALAKIKKDRERVRIMCCDALYSLRKKGLIILYIVITSWTEILPNYKEDQFQYLPLCIVHAIQTFQLFPMDCKGSSSQISNLSKLISNFYKYPDKIITSKKFIQKLLIDLMSPGYDRNVITVIILICKREGVQWTYENVINGGLLAIIVENNSPNIYNALKLLGYLMRSFPTSDNDGVVKKIIDQLCAILDSESTSADVQEGVVSALLSLSRHKFNSIAESIIIWHPSRTLSTELGEQLKIFFGLRPADYWRQLIKKKKS